MSEEQIRSFLIENIDYFVNNDLILSCFRKIGWMLVKGLNSLIEYSQMLYNATFGMVDLTRYAEVESFLSEYSVLIQAIMALSLVALGYMLIFGKEKRHDLLKSVLIFAVVATASSYLFTTMGSFAVLFKDAVISGSGVADGYTLVNQNLYDLKYIDEQIGLDNMSETNLPQYDSLAEQDVKMIDVTDTLSNREDGLSDAAKDILGKRLIYGRSGSGSVLTDVSGGIGGIGNTYYYRYQFHYARYYLNAVALLLIYFGLSYVNIKIVLELLRSRVFLTLFSADLSSKKKAVRILESVRDGFYALCFTAVELRLYLIVTDYVNQIDIPALLQSIIVLMIAFAVIGGSSIAEKITGVDAGLGSAMHGIMGATHMARGAVMFGMQAKQLSMLGNLGRDGENASGSGNGGSNMPEEPGNTQSSQMENMQTEQNANVQTEEGGNQQNLSNTEGDQRADIQEQSNMSEAGNGAYGESGLSGANMSEPDGDGSTAEENFARMDETLDTGAEGTKMEGQAKETSAGEGNMFERWEQNQTASQKNADGNLAGNFGEQAEISEQPVDPPGKMDEIPEQQGKESGSMFEKPEKPMEQPNKTVEGAERSMNYPAGTQGMSYHPEMPKGQNSSSGMQGSRIPSNTTSARNSVSEPAGRSAYAGRNSGSGSMMPDRERNGSAGDSQINKKEK